MVQAPAYCTWSRYSEMPKPVLPRQVYSVIPSPMWVTWPMPDCLMKRGSCRSNYFSKITNAMPVSLVCVKERLTAVTPMAAAMVCAAP